MQSSFVFISYARENLAAAQHLAGRLADFGIDSFLDTREINLRSKWEEVIQAGLERATHVMHLVSTHSLESDYVRFEVSEAKKAGKVTVDILLEGNLRSKQFDNAIQHPYHPDLSTGNVSDESMIDIITSYGLVADGIVPQRFLQRARRRLPDEVIAAELLVQDIVLSRSPVSTDVVINRNGVSRLVINNHGKRKICEDSVASRREIALELDRGIHGFFCGTTEPSGRVEMSVPCHEFPFRWASGGVLPIVRFRGRQWVQLFFRDIAPVGWNLSLGSSERHFDPATMLVDDAATDAELVDPWQFMIREFLEETLVVARAPRLGGRVGWKPFHFGQARIDLQEAQAARFSALHRQLRQDRDGFRIDAEGADPIYVRQDNHTGVSIQILRSDLRPHVINDVLVAINPLELGIEVVKVVEYDLEDDDCILDGEMHRVGDSHELIRMPVGLLSLDYVKRAFGADLPLVYTDDPVQPSVTGPAFEEGDVHLFQWDLDRRSQLAEAHGPTVAASEIARFQNWVTTYGGRFAGGGNAIPPLFTPTSAKVLEYYVLAKRRLKSVLI